MTAISSSFFRPVRTSASTPRSAKTRTAAGLSSSAMSTLGMTWGIRGSLKGSGEAGLRLGEDPGEPGGERLEVGRFHRGPAPEAQARGRVAVARDVVGDAGL